MPTKRYSVFNPEGEDVVTDIDRLGESQASRMAAQNAAAAELAARLQMQQADIADRQTGRAQELGFRGRALEAELGDRSAGREFQGRESQLGREFQGGMFDRQAGLQRELDKSQTDRSFGLADRQMQPSLMDAQLRQRQYESGEPMRQLQGIGAQRALESLQAGAPLDEGQFEQLAMIMALGQGRDVPNFGMRKLQEDELRAQAADRRTQRQRQQEFGDPQATQALLQSPSLRAAVDQIVTAAKTAESPSQAFRAVQDLIAQVGERAIRMNASADDVRAAVIQQLPPEVKRLAMGQTYEEPGFAEGVVQGLGESLIDPLSLGFLGR